METKRTRVSLDSPNRLSSLCERPQSRGAYVPSLRQNLAQSPFDALDRVRHDLRRGGISAPCSVEGHNSQGIADVVVHVGNLAKPVLHDLTSFLLKDLELKHKGP